MNEHLLEQILAPANLQAAWKQVKRNKGAAGVDGLDLVDYPKWAKRHWSGIRQALAAGYYIPQPIRRVEIPKPTGGKRLLGIPTVNDRVIQQAITQVLMPIFDRHFSSHSYGFRPNKSAHQAILSVRGHIRQGCRYAVDIDLSKFFDNVDHDLLMHRLGRRIRDKRVLKLIGRYLRAGVDIDGEIQPTALGVPQGGPLSPLLANILLDDLDKYLESKRYAFARYADDFVICVESQAVGERIKEDVERFFENAQAAD
ncbi:MAG: group II intron reverse transcriptase/maturase [Halobacteriota archaeon]